MRAFSMFAAATLLMLSACPAECPVGAEACACTPGGGCDTGLVCLSKKCVNDTGGTGGGSAGGSATGGGSGGGSNLLPDGGMKPPPPPPCTNNGACAAGELCTFDSNGTTACVKGSTRACDGGLCVNGMAFERHVLGTETNMRGHTCTTTSDCPVLRGSIAGICVDKDGTGAAKVCVPLCQYHDDAALMGCSTDPRFGVVTGCSRNHARIYATTSLIWYCSGYRMQNARCLAPTAQLTPEHEWTTSCIEDHLDWGTSSCAGITVIGSGACFFSTDRPDAKQGPTEFLDQGRRHLSYTAVAGGNGSSGGSSTGQCGTDCDCGHCSYCDKGGSGAVCRYAGEGPYGCYRGCD